MTTSMFWGRLIKDFQHKELIPLKFVFFIHASTVLVLYPYLTIHMRELGINVRETAIMSAVTPIVAILMPPIAGMVADKIGNFRLLLATLSTLVAPLALLLLFVPVGRLTITYPSTVILEVGCNSNKILSFGVDERNYSCIPAHPYQFDITGRIEACGLACDISSETNVHDLLLATEIQVSKDGLAIYQYYPKQEVHNESPMETSVVSRRLRNNEFYKDSVRLLGNNRIFFPLGYGFNCKSDFDNVMTCELAKNVTQRLGSEFRTTVLPKSEKTPDEIKEMMRKFQVVAWGKKQIGDKPTPMCDVPDTIHPTVTATSPRNTQITMQQCHSRCIATTPRKLLCSNLQIIQERNVQLTFWMYLSIRVMIGIIGGTTFAMFEGAVIALLREHKADYGLQRVYATIGGMISSPLSGWLIEWASQGKDYTDFRPAFYLYAFLKVTTGFLLLNINLDFKAPAKNVVTDFKTVLKNPEMIALLIACFILGTAWGYIESFLFWLIQDLGGSSSLMGITITIGGVFGIPLLILSGPIIDKIGHANVLFIGMVFYAVRLMGYSLIYNPWYCLIFEAMESVTTGLAFTAAVTYAAKLSTTTTDTTIQGLLGGLYFGVGKGAGSLIGGFMISAIGSRETYQVFATFTAAFGLCYALFNHFYLRKHSTEGNEIMKKEPPKVMEFKTIQVLDENEKKANGAVKENLGESEKTEEKLESVKESTGTVNPSFEEDTEAQKVNNK